MCVPCAFTIVLIHIHVTDENPRRNGKFDGRYTLLYCPFSHIDIHIYAHISLGSVLIRRVSSREKSRSSSAILGFLLMYHLLLVFPSVMTKPERPVFIQEAKQYILLAWKS